MKITAQSSKTTQNNAHRDLIEALYTAVDALDAKAIGTLLSANVQFRLGNFDPMQGRDAVVDANAAFFETIQGMQHTVSGLWSDGDTALCKGEVFYTRKDGSTHSVPFATILGIRGGLVENYDVFVDISGL